MCSSQNNIGSNERTAANGQILVNTWIIIRSEDRHHPGELPIFCFIVVVTGDFEINTVCVPDATAQTNRRR